MRLRRHHRLGGSPRLLVAVGLVLFLAIRFQLIANEVSNPDIGGILYNADLLLHGGLPYRDTIEIKPPGAFFLVAACFGTLGRDLITLQWFHAAWLLVGAPAIWIAAGDRKWAAALATAVYLFYVGMFTFNYSSWMVPLYAWAFACIVRSLDTGRAGWAIAAGVCAAWATLTIQRAVVLGPLALLLWLLGRRRRTTPLLWLGGAVLGALPVVVVYAAHGEAGTLVAAVVPFATAHEYSTAALGDGPFGVVEAAVHQLFTVFPHGLVLVGAAVVAHVAARRDESIPATRPTAAWLLLLASMIGAGLGGARYYLHYLVQYVPAIALMAADPTLLAAIRPRRQFLIVPLAVLAWAVVDIARGDAQRYAVRPRTTATGQTAAELAGVFIRQRTRPTDTIFVWGWSGWPVYYWAHRRSPGRVYKSLGTLTTFNSNTAFTLGRPVEFRPGPAAAEFIEDFDRRPPTFVVVTKWKRGPDPLIDFIALEQRLQRDYVPVKTFDDLLVLRRTKRSATRARR